MAQSVARILRNTGEHVDFLHFEYERRNEISYFNIGLGCFDPSRDMFERDQMRIKFKQY